MRKYKRGYTYADAGVNVEEVSKSHRLTAQILERTFKSRRGKIGEVIGGIGHYAGLLNLRDGRAIAVHVDGVGTKTMIASMMGKYDTVGVDCVAMNVNDLICMGVEPIALIDYLALEKMDENLVRGVMAGLVEGADRAGVAVVGGETAVMPDLVSGFDLAAMSLGVVDEKKIITGKDLETEDHVIGLESSGIHSNGLTLARKVLLSHYDVASPIPELGRSLGEELLEPTIIYVKPILEILERCEVHGLAHITGGAFTKLSRIGRQIGFKLDEMPPPKPVFNLIQRHANLDEREMYRTFNMGVGFCVITPESERSKAEEICQKHGIKCSRIGKVISTPGVWVKGVKIA